MGEAADEKTLSAANMCSDHANHTYFDRAHRLLTLGIPQELVNTHVEGHCPSSLGGID